jgi:hypothetical protein
MLGGGQDDDAACHSGQVTPPGHEGRKTWRQRRRTMRIRLGRTLSRMPTWLQAATAIVATAVLGGIGTLAYTTIHDAFADKFRVTVETNPDRITTKTGAISGSYVVAKPIQAIGEPPNNANTCVGRYEWAHGLGGIDADSTSARVTVEGTSVGVLEGCRTACPR